MAPATKMLKQKSVAHVCCDCILERLQIHLLQTTYSHQVLIISVSKTLAKQEDKHFSENDLSIPISIYVFDEFYLSDLHIRRISLCSSFLRACTNNLGFSRILITFGEWIKIL